MIRYTEIAKHPIELFAIAVLIWFLLLIYNSQINGLDSLTAARLAGHHIARDHCAGCHDLSVTQRPHIGPPLWQVMGRHPADDAQGFDYSTDYRKLAQLNQAVWSEELMHAYLAGETALSRHSTMFVPDLKRPYIRQDHKGNPFVTRRTHLFYPELLNPEQRQQLIVYLQSLAPKSRAATG
ncbi:MAG: c-type cytochrome [Magnetococcales bacterium]|nr:c-type cytochrome [Magnetococcales bacterium]